MTKKDFEYLADVFKTIIKSYKALGIRPGAEGNIKIFINDVINQIKTNFPKFNENKFRERMNKEV